MAKSDTPKALLDALDLIRGDKGAGAWAVKPQSLDALETRQVERVRGIFEDPNIVAIGIAEKHTEKKTTKELGLCFYVEKKIPKSRLRANQLIPPVMSVADRAAVFTDVQAIGKVRPQVNKLKSPIRSGYSIGNESETGTLGAIVQRGRARFLLSNSHVLADSGKGKVGDVIVYPGSADTSGKLQPVGRLSDILPFSVGDDFLNRVDAALAQVDDEMLDQLDLSIRGAKAPYATIAPKRGMKIVTRGRSSGDSSGEVQDVHFSIVMTYPGIRGKVGFIDQVKCSCYSKPGDSGAIVVDAASKKVVGLHFAGSGAASVFNPISDVMKALKFRFPAK